MYWRKGYMVCLRRIIFSDIYSNMFVSVCAG